MTSASISGVRKSALRSRSASSSEKVPPIKQAHTKQAQKEKKRKKDKKGKKERIVKKSLSQELEEEAAKAKAEKKKEEVTRKRKKEKEDKKRDVKTGDKKKEDKKLDVKTGDKEKGDKKRDVKTGDKEKEDKKLDVKTGDKEKGDKKRDVKTGDKEKEDKKRDVKTGDNEKKPDVKKEGKEKKDHGKKKRKKEEPKIVFSPAKKNQIEHIFQQPHDTKTPDPAGAPSTPSPTTPMSAKERAERHFEALSKCLAKSDSDDSDCHPETDFEDMVKGMEEPSAEGEDSETSDSDSEEESSETSTDEEEEETAKDETAKEETAKNVEEGNSEEEDLECEASEEESQEEDEVVEHPDKSTKQPDQSTKCHPNEHALVPVTAETTNQALALRNPMTNKKEWDAFTKQAKSKMPIGLNEMYTSNKQELFSIWLDQDRDWNACTLEVERRQESQNVSKRGWKAVQGKELKAKYSEEKWQKVLQARKAAGLFYEDEDFPGDDDDPRLIKSVSLFHFVWTPQTCTTWENP